MEVLFLIRMKATGTPSCVMAGLCSLFLFGRAIRQLFCIGIARPGRINRRGAGLIDWRAGCLIHAQYASQVGIDEAIFQVFIRLLDFLTRLADILAIVRFVALMRQTRRIARRGRWAGLDLALFQRRSGHDSHHWEIGKTH